ncbi:hypothetical protein HDU77_000039 [Chytriomyces hyalinus]|nr:hypothetical protein HDU77_000039 [Chytriomyces hyalinus]
MTSHAHSSATIQPNNTLRFCMSDLIVPIPRPPQLDESIKYVNKVFATQPLRQLSARQQPQHQPQFRSSTASSSTTTAASALPSRLICPQSGCRKILPDRMDLWNHLLTHAMQTPLRTNSSFARQTYKHSKARRYAPSRLSSISVFSLGRELVASRKISMSSKEENCDSLPRKSQYPGHPLRRTAVK